MFLKYSQQFPPLAGKGDKLYLFSSKLHKHLFYYFLILSHRGSQQNKIL